MAESPQPGPSKRHSSMEIEETHQIPFKKRILTDEIENELHEIQMDTPHSVPLDEIDDYRKRWLVVGICVQSVLPPVLRKYVNTILKTFWQQLKTSDNIDIQNCSNRLQFYHGAGALSQIYLNYEHINNNKTNYRKQYNLYDYRVGNHVDLAKLFLPTLTATFTAIDEGCDMSTVLGIIININQFPQTVRSLAEQVRTILRNPWAHCRFSEWNQQKFEDSLQLMGNLIKSLSLSFSEESKCTGELEKWRINGMEFLKGSTLGLELVNAFTKHVKVLAQCISTIVIDTTACKTTLQIEFNKILDSLKSCCTRITRLEKETSLTKTDLQNVKTKMKQIDADISDTVPKHVRAQHELYINEWREDEATFIVTRATEYVEKLLQEGDIVVVTGSSGTGKSSIIHHMALELQKQNAYDIIPFVTCPEDIIRYRNTEQNQVFIVDDICGKDYINEQSIQAWLDFKGKLDKLIPSKKADKTRKHSGTSGVSESAEEKGTESQKSLKILVSCRLKIFKDKRFKGLTLFTKYNCDLQSELHRLNPKEREQMIKKYKPGINIMILNLQLNKYEFFPLLCKMSKTKTEKELEQFFSAPIQSLRHEIRNVINARQFEYHVLVLCCLFNEGFNEQFINPNKTPEADASKVGEILSNIDLDLTKESNRRKLREAFDILDGTYVKKIGSHYLITHDKLYDLVSLLCGKELPEQFIKYAPSYIIAEQFRFETTYYENDDSFIYIQGDIEEEYFDRIISDVEKNDISTLFYNQQIQNDKYRSKLLKYLSDNLHKCKSLFLELDQRGIRTNGTNIWQNSKTTLIIEASKTGYCDIVNFLLKLGCDVNRCDDFKRPPMYFSCAYGHLPLVKLLLENNASIMPENYSIFGGSPLSAACKNGHIKIVEFLIEKKFDVSINEWESLTIACKRGHTAIVELLLSMKTCASKSDSRVWGAAMTRGQTDIVKLLLSHRSVMMQCDSEILRSTISLENIEIVNLVLQDIRDLSGSTEPLLYFGCITGNLEVVNMLLERNADSLICLEDNQESPLLAACRGGHNEVVNKLLEWNADVFQFDCEWENPVSYAISKGDTKLIKSLLNSETVLSPHNADGRSHLISTVCEIGNIETLKMLLNLNSDISESDPLGSSSFDVLEVNDEFDEYTPMSLACLKGHFDLVKYLLEQNSELLKNHPNVNLPLHVACDNAHLSLVKLLLDKRADVSQCDEDGCTPLHFASQRGHADIVRLLIEKKADVLVCDDNGRTPLYVASQRGHVDIVRLLIEKKADVLVCDDNGLTPLYVASQRGHVDIVRLLMEKNADVLVCDKSGLSPYDIASLHEFPDVVDCLNSFNNCQQK